MIATANTKELDLHGHRLFDAELLICDALEEAYYNDGSGLLLIHGFNDGTAIRDFIWRGSGLHKKLRRFYPELPGINLQENGPGSTHVGFAEEE